MQEYAELAVVGAVISVVVQFVKNSPLGTSPNATRLVVIGLSVVAAFLYQFFRDTAIWEAALQALLYANGIYGFLIKPFFEE